MSERVTTMEKAARLVFIPGLGAGHLVSAIQFANLLLERHHHISITLLVIKLPSDTTTAAYTHSLLNSQRLQLINLPETPSNSQPTLMNETIELQKPHVREAISNLSPTPPLAAFVVDMFFTTMIDVAKEFNVPSLVFFTSGLAFLGLMLHLHTLKEEENAEFTEFDAEWVIPSFAKPIPARNFPSVTLRKEWEEVFMNFGRGLKKADGFIVNSFEELESHAAQSFFHGPQAVYAVGPILNPKPKPHANAHADNADIFDWLDQQPPSSVLFLCFGSMGSFGEDQVREIARALENSGARFLWSLRKPPPKGSTFMTPPSDYAPSELPPILPAGFLDRTAGIGKVIGWAPQAQILAHRATGGFVSHCGWNSSLESIHFGVPIATWPLYAEQQTNAFLLVRELEIALEISLDYRVDFMGEAPSVLSAEKIENGIRNLVEIDDERRKRVVEASEKSRTTLLEGGCSHSSLGRFVDYVMNQV
ncbi:anthocyanidin 3-O-glucosyltransferase 2-like [Vigna unguiculata]|uniref:anthocyanidin 3-O-glucosyltransferase 2-like n=1 Tax=Vigna unguiculata TaxID=3917 RepID=UPI001015D413|nr:anthocyanidin 3-O-glucosyltransferase 2-like [Vigna unguiculata]